jgi:hypothetical protein
VSDISLGPGIGVALGLYATIAAAIVMLAVAVIAPMFGPREGRLGRGLRYAAGSVACFAVGVLYLAVASSRGDASLKYFDEWCADVPSIGVALGSTTIIALETARRVRYGARPARALVVKGAVSGALVSVPLAWCGRVLAMILFGPDTPFTPSIFLIMLALAGCAGLLVGIAGTAAALSRQAT